MNFKSTNEERRKILVSALTMNSPQYNEYDGIENYMCWRIVMAGNPEICNVSKVRLACLETYFEEASPVVKELIKYIDSALGEHVIVEFDPDDETTQDFSANDLRNFWLNQMLSGIYLESLSGVIHFYKYSK